MKTRRSFFIVIQAFIFIFFLNPKALKSQYFDEWSEKILLTDSVSDHFNADLAVIQYVSEPSMNMAWENTTDENSTAILYRDLLSSSGLQVVVSEAGVHFTHPKIVILNYDSPDDNFYVFYQSDQDGNEDIYYMKYGTDGQFTGPFAFATDEYDQANFVSENFTYFDLTEPDRYIVKTLVWTSNGQLMTCDLEKNGDLFSFSEPVLLDSGNCSDSYIYNNQIFYIREDESGRFIYYIFRQYPSNTWSAPSVYFDQGNCYNLAGDHVMPQYLTWSADSIGVFRNYIANTYNEYNGYRIGPESDTQLDPAICTIILSVAPQPLQFYDFYMVFPYPDNGNDEIYMNSMYNFPPVFENFSQSGTTNRNPEFFTGEYDPVEWWCFWVYLTWEEYRNDHWQIFSSKTLMCAGGVEENEDSPLSISAFPNPFRDELKVSFELSTKDFVKIEVFDLFGRKVNELYSGIEEKGEHQVTDNCKDFPSGIYLIRLSTSKVQSSLRVMKMD